MGVGIGPLVPAGIGPRLRVEIEGRRGNVACQASRVGVAVLDQQQRLRSGDGRRGVGHIRKTPAALRKQRPVAAVSGNVRRHAIFSGARLNTDDRPVIEYIAPRIERDRYAGRIQSLSWKELLVQCMVIPVSVPNDPFLAGVPESLRVP